MHGKRNEAKPDLDELESLVREGKFGEAKRRLRDVVIKRIPRTQALAYANLARRLGLGRLSLRILNPIVRPEGARLAPATPDEKIEYAAALRSLGIVPEACSLLENVDLRARPDAGFQLALCLISQWRYRQAIPLLQSYIGSFREASYAMHVGRVNLLAALVHEERIAEARGLLDKLHRDIDRSKFSLLYQRSLILAAQCEILSQAWSRAKGRLAEAASLPDEATDPVNSLLIQKWLAVAQSMKSRSASPELRKVRTAAIGLRMWEVVRDCDFYEATISCDRDALVRLYVGTPFASYREKILKSARPPLDVPEAFLWSGDRRAGHRLVLDLVQARTIPESASLPPGQALHQLLIVLSQDFYQPQPLLSIFSKLFPDELFHPDTSPNRVRQVIKRLRQWFVSSALPLRLEESVGRYRLSFKGPLSISIPADPLPLEQTELEFLKLRRSLKTESFTTRDAQAAIGASRSAIQRLLQWAVEKGRVRREGQSHGTRYTLSG